VRPFSSPCLWVRARNVKLRSPSTPRHRELWFQKELLGLKSEKGHTEKTSV
jgi:hypothetical protein